MKIFQVLQRVDLLDSVAKCSDNSSVALFYTWDERRLSISTEGCIIQRIPELYDKLNSFVRKWGMKVFSLGRYQNTAGKQFMIVAIPYGFYRDKCDLTTLTASAEGLNRLMDARNIQQCIMCKPVTSESREHMCFYTVCLPVLELLWDDRVLVIDERKEA